MEVDDVVARREADKARVRAPECSGPKPKGKVFGRSGMEMFEAIFSGELPPRPINDTVNVLEIPIEQRSSTALVRAEGKLIHAGRQVAVAEGRIVGPDGKIYAHATTTCLIFDQPTLTTRSSHEQA